MQKDNQKVTLSNYAITATICVVLICICMFICGARYGLHDAQTIAEPEETPATEPVEVIIKHEYEYIPLQVDYEPLPDCVNVDETDATLLAKTLYGEYRDSTNYPQCAAVCWCILNRVDAEGFGDTVKEVVTAPYQFQGYSERNPVDAELYKIAVDVLARHAVEEYCIGDVGRVIGADCLWFESIGMVNEFRNAYIGGERIVP